MKFTKEIIMGITAKELAQKLNLSEAAISMALNNKPGVSTKTRKKIIEEAKAANKSIRKYCEENGLNYSSVYSFIRKHK